ncbi:hypothetical protein GGQ86_003004 [Xanthobacter flavus]|uniref:Uncharacterized protein n=1 Tax=Xanthobacter flavus TaxID=281 RepID=A0ABU1KI67_XANFL|nr:hypothetical protein [Xanthobacter flavus]
MSSSSPRLRSYRVECSECGRIRSEIEIERGAP